MRLLLQQSTILHTLLSIMSLIFYKFTPGSDEPNDGATDTSPVATFAGATFAGATFAGRNSFSKWIKKLFLT